MKLDRFQMAAVKRTAQNTKKFVAQRNKINDKMRELAGELVRVNAQIDAWEEPIKVMTNGYTSEQVIAWEGEIPDEEQMDIAAEVASIHNEEAVGASQMENDPF